jgi:hypothetical protein
MHENVSIIPKQKDYQLSMPVFLNCIEGQQEEDEVSSFMLKTSQDLNISTSVTINLSCMSPIYTAGQDMKAN